MKIDKIGVSYGGPLNLGNYQTARIDVELGAALDSGDDPAACCRLLFDRCREMVSERARILIKQKNATVSAVVADLPPDVRTTMKIPANLEGVS